MHQCFLIFHKVIRDAVFQDCFLRPQIVVAQHVFALREGVIESHRCFQRATVFMHRALQPGVSAKPGNGLKVEKISEANHALQFKAALYFFEKIEGIRVTVRQVDIGDEEDIQCVFLSFSAGALDRFAPLAFFAVLTVKILAFLNFFLSRARSLLK